MKALGALLALSWLALAVAAVIDLGLREDSPVQAATREVYPVCVTHGQWCVQITALRFVEVRPGPETGSELVYERLIWGQDFKAEPDAKAYARQVLKDGACHFLEGDTVEECIPPALVQNINTSYVP